MSRPEGPGGAAAANRPEPPPPARLSPWRLLLTVLFTVGLVILFLTQVSLGRILQMIREADAPPFVLACLAYAFTYIGRAARWRLLTTSRKMPWGPMLGITAVHNFMVRALPAKLGETAYPVMMRTRGVPGSEALAGLVVARIYDTAAAIVFFMLSVLLAGAAFRGSILANALASVAVLGLCALAVLRGNLFVRALRSLVERAACISWVPRFLTGAGVRGRLVRLESSLAQMQSLRQAPWLILTTVWIWLPSFLMTWWLLKAFDAPHGFWPIVFASSLAMVATFLPVGTLGNFGTQEAGWTAGLMLLGTDRETAIATGFSTHLVGFALAGLFGLAGAWSAGIGFLRGRKETARR